MKKDVFYYFENEEIKHLLANGAFVVDFSNTDDVYDLFKNLSKLLNFPSYFGNNWNALYECLIDLHWITEEKIVLLHNELPKLPDNDLKMYLKVLSDAVKDWKKTDERKFKVLFHCSLKKQIKDLIQ